MTYQVVDMIGPDIQNVDTVQQYNIGMRCKALHEVYGAGDFVYLRGVAGTLVGDAVVYDENGQTTRAVAASRGTVAVAVQPVLANQFGWYQVQGLGPVRATTVVADSRPYLTATAGQLDDTVAAGQAIDGMRFQSADGVPSAGLALAILNYPMANGNG